MRKLLFISVLTMFFAMPLLSQTGALQGHSFLGGTAAKVSGLNSTNYLDGIIPSATITVYLTGTTNLATIFKDGQGDSLSNPFTSNALNSVNPGGWIFWAATNQGLDVVMSGGISPNTYPQPVTLVDVFPTQSFSPVSGVASIIGNSPIAVNSQFNVACSSGTCTISCPSCTGTGLVASQVTPPVAGQYVIIPANTAPVITTSNCTTITAASASPWSGSIDRFNSSSAGGCTTFNTGLVWTGFTLTAGISPSNVTAVYALVVAQTTCAGNSPINQCGVFGASGNGITILTPLSASWPAGTYGAKIDAGSPTTFNFATANIAFTNDSSANWTSPVPYGGIGTATPYLAVYYTGTPVSQANNQLLVAPPLNVNQGILSLPLPYDVSSDTGTSGTNYIATIPGYGPLAGGTAITVVPLHTNTSTAPTLAFNGSSAFTIELQSGSPLSTSGGGDIQIGVPFSVEFDGQNSVWRLQNPIVSSGGSGSAITALTGDVTASGPGSAAASVVRVNGAAVPASQPCLGSNSSSQLINGTCGGTTDTRPTAITVTGKTATLGAGGSTQVFNVSSGGGTITFYHMTIEPTGGDSANLMQNSTLIFDCDGDSESVPMGLFLMSQDGPLPFNTDQVSVSVATNSWTGPWTFNRKVWMNFTTSCTITLVNASSSATANIYVDVTYRVGVNPNPGSMAHWHATYTTFPSLAANTGAFNNPQVYVLPSTTFSGGGQVESYAEYINSSTNYTYFEGTPIVTCDSATCGYSGGGEDFFGSGYYADFGAQSLYTDKWGLLVGSQLQLKAGANDFLGYRFFTAPADYATFTSTLSVSTANGDSSVSPGVVNLSGLVTYWTADPVASTPTFSPSPGSYAGAQSVTLSTTTSGAAICYTTDGSTPTAPTAGTCSGGTTQTYSSAISVSSTTTIKALASKSGFLNSSVASGTYTIGGYVFPSYVGTCNNVASSSQTATVSCTMSVTAGDLIFQYCSATSVTSGGSVSSILSTSSPSSTFHLVNGTLLSTSAGAMQSSYAFATSGGSTTFTCTINSPVTSEFQGIQVLDYTPHSVTTLEGANIAGAASTSTYTSATLSATSTDSFWIVCANTADYVSGAFSADSIGALTTTGRTLSLGSSAIAACFDAPASAPQTSITGTVTSAGGPGHWLGIIAAFQ